MSDSSAEAAAAAAAPAEGGAGKRKESEKAAASKSSDTLNCPICLEVFSGKVFQCTSGHAICEACKEKLPLPRKCPTCRILLGDIRNRLAEELAALLPKEAVSASVPDERPAAITKCFLPRCAWKDALQTGAGASSCHNVKNHLIYGHNFKPMQMKKKREWCTMLKIDANNVNSDYYWNLVFGLGHRHFVLVVSWKKNDRFNAHVVEIQKKSFETMEITLSGHGYSAGWRGPLTDTGSTTFVDSLASCNFLSVGNNHAKLIATGGLEASLADAKFDLAVKLFG